MDMSPTPSRWYQTLPGWGMTRGGALWALGTWAHPTAENDGSAWRTPSAQEPGVKAGRLEGGLGHRNYDKVTGRLAQVGLTQQAEGMWPTPQGRDYRSGQAQRWENPERSRNLNDQVAWMTPTSRDWKDGASPSEMAPTNGLLGRCGKPQAWRCLRTATSVAARTGRTSRYCADK